MIISVIIPVYNEEKYISKCLDSLLNNTSDNSIEVLIVDGDSSDNTCDIINAQYLKKYDNIRLLHNPKRIAPVAMNIGIREAKGDFIIRLDAHSSFNSNYIDYLISNARKYNTDNIGCVCKTDVLHKTKKSLAIKKVLSNRFGVGASQFRVGIKEPMEVDTVPFGCFKREALRKYGIYNEKLVRNQDIELNKRIIKGGGKIILLPEAKATYYARETFKALAKNNYANGMWNIYTVWITKNISSLSLRHFIPLGLVLALGFPFIFIPFFGISTLVFSLLIFLIYFLFILMVSIKEKEKSSLYLLVSSFIVLHTSYGVGSLVGLLTFWKK